MAENLSQWGGIDNVLLPEKTPPNFLKRADNVNIDKQGGITKRQGYSLVSSGDYNSLYADDRCFVSKNGDLVEVLQDDSEVVLKSNVGSDLDFLLLDGVYYFVSPTTTGKIVGNTVKPFGIPQVLIMPTLSYTTGSLVAGTYQVAYTYVDSAGLEGGTIAAAQITVPDNSSVLISNIQTNGYKVRVYASNGGSQMYKLGDTTNTSYSFSSVDKLVTPLRTFNISDAPKGQLIGYHKGRVYIAQGNALFYSEAQKPDKFHLEHYLLFPAPITALMPVEDGIWVGSDALYFLAGVVPKQMTRETKSSAKCIAGSSVKVPGEYIGEGIAGYHWMVTTTHGVLILSIQGQMQAATKQHVDMGNSDGAAAVHVQQQGMNQYLSLLKNNRPNNFRVSDSVTVTHISNGIVIN